MWLGLLAAFAATPELSVGYHGDMLTHPGVTGRAAWALSPRNAMIEVESGGWWHPGNMTAVYARGGPSVRYLSARGMQLGAFAHVGAMHGLWTSPTYAVEDREVTRRHLAGDTWATLTVGAELGHTWALGEPAAWFVRPQLGARIPTFHGMGLDLAVQAGVRFGGPR